MGKKMGKKIVVEQGDALGIIDMLNDFVDPSGALPSKDVPGETSMKDLIKRSFILGGYFPFTFFAEDRHPMGHIEFGKYGSHAVQGTWGQKCISELAPLYERASDIVKKGTALDVIGLSVATSSDFPAHLSLLRQQNTKRIFLLGLYFTHCVGYSATAYFQQGFDVYVIRDCTRSIPAPYGDHVWMERLLNAFNINMINFEDIKLG